MAVVFEETGRGTRGTNERFFHLSRLSSRTLGAFVTTETLFPNVRQDGTFERPKKGLLETLWHWLPRGDTLPENDWQRRHEGILVLMVVHILGLTAFAIWKQIEPSHLVLEMGALAGLTGLAALPVLNRRTRGVFAAVALITTSALLTHFSGGYIEAHFHFFVMLGVIVLYEDWVTFLLSIGYVALHHGFVGTVDPASVYNHPSAFSDPWLWAGIHAAFILWLSAALVIYWRTTERLRNRSELVLKSSGAGLVGVNSKGLITFANPAVAQLTDRPHNAWVGRPFKDLLREESAAPMASTIGPRRGEATVQSRAGDKAVEFSLTPALSHGQVVGHVASLIDITERKSAELALRRFNEELEIRVRQRTHELEEALREIESFSYSVSHDLRSPLRVIRGFSELLLEDLGSRLDAERRGQLEHVHRASERMNGTIESLLRLSRISRTELRRQPVDLSNMAETIIEQLRAENPDRKVEVRIQPGIIVDADPELARVVLANLLGNAWKFSRERTVGRVDVLVETENGRPIVVVRDNGAGFRIEDGAEMFQPFKRFHDPGRFEGTGIGLATVARILKRHGGAIRATGSPEQGASFRFHFGEASVSASNDGLPRNGTVAEKRLEVSRA